MSNWAIDLETQLYTIVSYKAEKRLKTKFPNINFTMTDLPKDTDIQYPTVYIHALESPEKGQDLANETINALMYSMQVEVITNKTQADISAVFGVLIDIFKELRFSIIQMPLTANGDTYYKQIMRVRRMIGSGDVDYLQ